MSSSMGRMTYMKSKINMFETTNQKICLPIFAFNLGWGIVLPDMCGPFSGGHPANWTAYHPKCISPQSSIHFNTSKFLRRSTRNPTSEKKIQYYTDIFFGTTLIWGCNSNWRGYHPRDTGVINASYEFPGRCFLRPWFGLGISISSCPMLRLIFQLRILRLVRLGIRSIFVMMSRCLLILSITFHLGWFWRRRRILG